MITLKAIIGGQSTSGISFNVTETQVDTIYTTVSGLSTSTQVVNMWYEDGTEKNNVFDTINADFDSDLTIVITLQASLDTDVDFYSGIGVNIKEVMVELIDD